MTRVSGKTSNPFNIDMQIAKHCPKSLSGFAMISHCLRTATFTH